jgi:hypothetical protein
MFVVYRCRMSHPILKTKHSLIGKNLLPVVLKTKAQEDEIPLLARLIKEHPLENYSLEELLTEFKRLTGTSAEEVMGLAGKDVKTREHVRIAMHHAIVQANLMGAPKVQTFTAAGTHQPATPKTSTTSGNVEY